MFFTVYNYCIGEYKVVLNTQGFFTQNHTHTKIPVEGGSSHTYSQAHRYCYISYLPIHIPTWWPTTIPTIYPKINPKRVPPQDGGWSCLKTAKKINLWGPKTTKLWVGYYVVIFLLVFVSGFSTRVRGRGERVTNGVWITTCGKLPNSLNAFVPM